MHDAQADIPARCHLADARVARYADARRWPVRVHASRPTRRQAFSKSEFERLRESKAIPPPWNLKLVQGPLVDSRLPLMREDHDVDLDYHVRHSALPYPGGQRELGILVSRLHSHQLDMHRPLWEVHLIEGLEGERFAIYLKMHHSLIDGVSGMRLILRSLSTNPDDRGTPAFWTVGAGSRAPSSDGGGNNSGLVSSLLGTARDTAAALTGVSRAALDLSRAAIDSRPLQAPYRGPDSALQKSHHRPAALRDPAIRIRADQVALESGRMHAQRHRPLPVRHRAAPLPVRTRSCPRSSPDRGHPGQPARPG